MDGPRLAAVEKLSVKIIDFADETETETKTETETVTELFLKVETVKRYNDTALVFLMANNQALFVWNGETVYKDANGTLYPVCEATATCAALYVDDNDEKEQLVEKANAALEAGGFTEAAARRRLGSWWDMPCLHCVALAWWQQQLQEITNHAQLPDAVAAAPLRPPHPLRNGNGLGMGSRNGYQHPGIPGERGPILGVPGWCRPRVPIHGYHHREPTRPRALAQPRSGTGDLQIFASRVLSDGISPHGFIDERFATVRPRLVAGRFIRKGSSLSLVKGVCVVSGRCVSVQTVYVVQCPHPAIVAHVERSCRSLRKGCPRIVAPSPHVAPPDGVRPSPQLSTPPTCSIVGEEKFTLRLISTMSTGPCTRVESASILVSGAK